MKGLVIASKVVDRAERNQKVGFTLRQLASGMYMVKVVTEDGVEATPLIIAH